MASAVLTATKTATASVAPIPTTTSKETSKTAEAAAESEKSAAVLTAAVEDEDCKDDDVLNSSLRSCANDPDFAVICAFLQKFANDLDLTLSNFKQLQEWLTNTDEVADQLRDMHIKLLRKIRKSVQEKNWETAVSKFCFTYSAQDGWEVERFGYKKSSLKVKLHILRELLESQFERNIKFRNKILTLDADLLRSQPVGRDRLGHTYWLIQDVDSNLRIYQEHLDEEIWQVVATNRDEFVNLISRLRGNEVVLPSTDIGVIDEDTSSSNSCAAPIEKPPPPEEQEDDSQEEEAKVPNLRIKLGGNNNSTATVSTAVDVGKGEEELAAEEDAKLEKKKLAAVTKTVPAKSGVKTHDDANDDDEEEEEEEEEGEEEFDEEDESDAEDDDEDEAETPKDAAKSDPNKLEKKKIAVPPDAQKKVKPLLISQAKIVASTATQSSISTNTGTKKRVLDEVDKSLSALEDIGTVKKLRPTLLDSKREKKPSRYEKSKSEDEEADEEEDDEEEGEEEEDDDIEEGEEEDIDSAAAEEDENEEKDIEDDDDDDEVGKAIEDPPIIVRGEGAGKMCDGANPTEITTFFVENTFLLTIEDEDSESEPEISEAIEEELLYIRGEGYGAECLVGNTKNEETTVTPTTITNPSTPTNTTSELIDEPKAKFFFGEPGCLKLSPIKKTPSKEDDEKIDQESNEDNIDKVNVAEKHSTDEKNKDSTVEKETITDKTEQIHIDKNDETTATDCDKMSAVIDDKKLSEEDAETLNNSKRSSKTSHEINETKEKHPTNGSTKIVGDIKTNGKDESESNKGITITENDKETTSVKDVKESNKIELIEQKNLELNKESAENCKTEKETTKDFVKNISISEPENLNKTADLKDDNSIERPTHLAPVKEVKNIPHEALKETNEKPLEKLPDTLNFSQKESNSALPSKSSLEVTPASSSNSTSLNLHNRKRRLTDLIAAEKTATRHSTSESEPDLNNENQEKTLAAAGAPEDDIEDVADVGGKRFKMRPKLTNSEIRKKVEAQKIAIEETTSSSGEEDARRRRKINSPKRQWTEKHSPQEEAKESLKDIDDGQNDDCLKVASAVDVPISVSSNTTTTITQSTVKPKITLAEIIEKKLKKNADTPISECAVATASTSSAVVAAVVVTPPTKKVPITKPLKKNLLTQLRQEESDEESIPRKRIISATFGRTIEKEETPDPLDISEMNKDEFEACNTLDRKIPERQRKRRSSAQIKPLEKSGNNATEYVVEKLKKSDSDVEIKKVNDSPNLPKSPEEKVKTKSIDPSVSGKTENLEMKSEVLRETTPPDTAVGRRSSRRGGAAVIYTELPEPKRTRSVKSVVTPIATPKVKKELVKAKELTDTKPKLKTPDVKKSTAVVVKKETKPTPTKTDLKIDNIKTETSTESKSPVKSNVKEEKSAVVESATPSTVSASTIKTSITPKSLTTTPKSTGRKMREIDTVNILENVDSEAPVRQSRRIAQQKIKEEAERRKLEEIALRTMKNELKKKKKAEAQADPTVAEISEHSSSSSAESEEEEEEAKKSKKKKCPGKDGTWSSGSEEQDEPEEEEEHPPHFSDHGSPLFKSDHEFSPESELEDESQVVPMKRARTARKEDAEGDTDDEEEACQKCGKSDHPEWILLCDTCDKGYHCSCLYPVLFYIPEGEWHCPPCQQEQLIAALEEKLQEFDDVVERRKWKDLEDKRLAQEAELAAKERQLEEKLNRKHKNKKENGKGDDSSENEDDSDDDSKHSGKKRNDDDDDDDKDKSSVKRDKKSKKNTDEKSKRRRDGGGGSRRRRRRAATRGARRRRRNESHSGSIAGSDDSGSTSKSGSGSDTTGSNSSSSSATDSDNEPIYKLRKRRQINVSYRLNEYDDLINSALKKEMGEAAVVGSVGRGKDISTIIEADKEHETCQELETEARAEEAVDKERESNVNEEEETNAGETTKSTKEEKADKVNENDSEEEPLKRKSKGKSNLKKKARKLTTLDISSEDDNASDEDFKTSSFDDDEEEDTSISASNSDSSLEVYRRRSKGSRKKTRKAARRAARERRKQRKFLVDDSEEEEEARPKTKKKRKGDSDYTETEDELSELSENLDSADLCDDSTSSENSDGAWRPSKRKKQRKSSAKIARKSPKLKKPQIKKPKRVVEYSDDDISEDEEEEYDDDDDVGGGKGSGKQPRSVPLKSTSGKGKGKGKGKGGSAGTGKSSKSTGGGKKKKKNMSDDDEESFSDSDDSTRRTRGRRYAYLDDFEDDSSDGGIKPGVHRPDTPPEEREKFIKKQEEIKRMLAEKNAEGAKLAATPRLTPIKGAGEKGTRSPAKPGDSLSTVPLSVIRQAKVLDIDYLQRKGESVSDVDNVDDVDSEFDDADLPDDFPEDMDEDAIARMVEEEEELVSAAAARELPAPDDVLKTTPSKQKFRENDRPPVALGTNPSLAALSQIPTTSVGPSTSASGLQEPMRKRLPMPTMHPPLLRHQYPGGHHPGMPAHMMHRHPGHPGPPTHLLQNALSSPLGQAVHRNFPQHAGMGGHHRIPPSGMPPRHGMPLRHATPPRHAMPPHLLPPAQQQLSGTQQLLPSTSGAAGPAAGGDSAEPKPRGRRKKITPLRDPLQKQQAAAAATAAAAVQASSTTGAEKGELIPKAEINTGVIKTAPPTSASLGIAQPPQLYKPPQGSNSGAASVITRMPHLPPPGRGMPSGPPGMYAGGDVTRFYGPPGHQGARHAPGSERHRGGPPQIPGMPSHHGLRPSYGPPPLRGVPVTGSHPPPGSVSSTRSPYLPTSHSEHHVQPPTGPYGPPPPARHATSHMNQYRPSTYGSPNYPPRGAPPRQNLRTSGPLGPEYHAGPRAYAPYGYYPPPPPLTAGHPPSIHPSPRSLHPASAVPIATHANTTQPPQAHPPPPQVHPPPPPHAHPNPPHAIVSAPSAAHAAVPSSVIVTAPPSNSLATSVVRPPPPTPTPTSTAAAADNHETRAITDTKLAPSTSPTPPAATLLVKNEQSSAMAAVAAETTKSNTAVAVPSIVVAEPRSKKLITLETYATSKSPLAIGGESSGSRSSPNVQPDAANDSSSTPAATSPGGGGNEGNRPEGASEFSGLVSYFSSQHDDYNT